MTISQIKEHLSTADSLNFILPTGKNIPPHFHVTEVGIVTKDFIDCGGTIRKEAVANFQLLDANDFDHRLKPQKLLNIISLSERKLGLKDLPIEVEYQTDTIAKYSLDFNGTDFMLIPKHTACLAEDKCGITPIENVSEQKQSCCGPDAKCC